MSSAKICVGNKKFGSVKELIESAKLTPWAKAASGLEYFYWWKESTVKFPDKTSTRTFVQVTDWTIWVGYEPNYRARIICDSIVEALEKADNINHEWRKFQGMSRDFVDMIVDRE